LEQHKELELPSSNWELGLEVEVEVDMEHLLAGSACHLCKCRVLHLLLPLM